MKKLVIIALLIVGCAPTTANFYIGMTTEEFEDNNHNINVELIEKLITPQTKVIIPVHFGGHPCEMNKILKIAKQ